MSNCLVYIRIGCGVWVLLSWVRVPCYLRRFLSSGQGSCFGAAPWFYSDARFAWIFIFLRLTLHSDVRCWGSTQYMGLILSGYNVPHHHANVKQFLCEFLKSFLCGMLSCADCSALLVFLDLAAFRPCSAILQAERQKQSKRAVRTEPGRAFLELGSCYVWGGGGSPARASIQR